MLWMTESVEPYYSDLASHVDDRSQSLGGIALSPPVFRQHIAGDSQVGFFESETRASQEPPVSARPDQIRTRRPSDPLLRAEPHEGLCLGH
jgi:hypothetical protein